MADPFPPLDGRESRIGLWVSGAVHAALIGWVALGGALFRPQPAPAIRMSEVRTMSEAEFQALAAASRGAGPVGDEASAPPAQPRTPADEVAAGGPAAVAPPVPDPDPQALPAPLQAREAAPNLSDVMRPQTPVEVATIAPEPRQPGPAEDAPVAPAPVAAPGSARPPAPPESAPVSEGASPAVATAPAPLLTASQAPFDVAGARTRLAERQAAARAEALARAEAERQAAEARAQAEAERQRQAAAEAARQAAERQAAAAAAEAQRRAAGQAEAAEQARIAAEAAARERAERAAAEAAAREEAQRAEAEARAREEAERQAALDAERAAAEAARQAEERRLAEEAAREEQRRAEQERRRAEEEAAAQAAAEALARAEAEAERAQAEALAREQAEIPRQAPPDQDLLSAALSEAMEMPPEGAGAQGGGGRAPSGPPLSAGEKDSFRLAIAECWNIGALSREAQRTTVSVAFSLTPDGMPEPDSIRLVSHEGGSDAAGQQAFEAARRAIRRCALQQEGYRLPPQKYDRWREVIVDFRPAGGPRLR